MSETHALQQLIDVCRRLLAEDGCPWDREQTLETITPYLQEETFELLEAIGQTDDRALREEMGDLFYLLVFAAALGPRQNRATDLATVLQEVTEKLVRRHPHVFGENEVRDTDGAVKQWEEIKKAEKGESTTLGHRPAGLPALTTAFRIQEKAAAVRFEWTDVQGAMRKLREELAELEETLEHPGPDGELRRRDEIGDLLYSVVNVARYLRIDPELALRETTQKFIHRFRYIEDQLARRGRTPATSSLEEMDAIWNEAKERGIR